MVATDLGERIGLAPSCPQRRLAGRIQILVLENALGLVAAALDGVFDLGTRADSC